MEEKGASLERSFIEFTIKGLLILLYGLLQQLVLHLESKHTEEPRLLSAGSLLMVHTHVGLEVHNGGAPDSTSRVPQISDEHPVHPISSFHHFIISSPPP